LESCLSPCPYRPAQKKSRRVLARQPFIVRVKNEP
jgi:hypothetical protein